MRVVLTNLSVTGRLASSPVSARLAARSLAPKPPKTNTDPGIGKLGPSPLRYTNNLTGTKDRAGHLEHLRQPLIQGSNSICSLVLPEQPSDSGDQGTDLLSFCQTGSSFVPVTSNVRHGE